MKTYYDNFNLVKGCENRVTEYVTIGRHTLLKTEMFRDGKLQWRDWMHRIDTRDAQYPSLACIMGAASFSFAGRRFFPVFWGFLRGVILH